MNQDGELNEDGEMNEDKEMNEDGEEETNTRTNKKVYGGCEGPDSMYVKLISSDRHEFFIKRKLALISGTIRVMLGGSGPGQNIAENEVNEINFREIQSHVLERVCSYFAYKARYDNSSREVPKFPIQKEIALELLLVSNFLDC